MIRTEEILHIGKLTKPHGKVGEVACVVENSYLDAALEHNDVKFIVLDVDNIFVPFLVENIRVKNADTFLFSFEGIHTEEQAQKLCSAEAYVLRRDMPADFEEELAYSELKGFVVFDEKNGRIGTIAAVDESTINTLIELDNGMVLPLHEDFISQVDISARTIVLNLPDGLLN